jgi:hypothetical protein
MWRTLPGNQRQKFGCIGYLVCGNLQQVRAGVAG